MSEEMPGTDKPLPVREGEELNTENLNGFLSTRINGFGKITGTEQFGGGYSNLTYLIKTTGGEFVLRRPPFGAGQIKGGHNMEREFSVISRLKAAGFDKVPEPLAYCDDTAITGSEFYVMSRLNGLILRTTAAHDIATVFDAARMWELSVKLCRGLADLHRIDIFSTGLVSIGKPEGYITRQLEGWSKRYDASQTDDIPGIGKLVSWLSQHMPREISPALIHNDYKFDNVVFDPDTMELKAVLDWEMTTVGDPRMDIGTALSYWAEAGDGGFEKNFNITWLPGNLTREEFVKVYTDHNPIDLSEILYFYVFGLFKNAVVMQQIYARFKKGLTRDPRFGGLIHGVKRLAVKGEESIAAGKMV